MESILEVRDEPRQFPLHVSNQPSEGTTSELEGVILSVVSVLFLSVEQGQVVVVVSLGDYIKAEYQGFVSVDHKTLTG